MHPEKFLERPLPSDGDAERVLLGTPLLFGKAHLATIAAKVSPADFYNPLHRAFYQALLSMLSNDTKLDPITLAEQLKKEGMPPETYGGASVLTGLTHGIPYFEDDQLEIYIQLVLDKAKLRQLIAACTEIIRMATAEEQPVADVLEAAEQKIFALAHAQAATVTEMQLFPVAADLLAEKAQQIEDKVHVTGLTTGLKDLDSQIGGYQRGDLIIVAGRPSMGKTALVTKGLVDALAPINGVGVFFSAEMTTKGIVGRIVCQFAHMNLWRFNRNHIMEGEWERLTRAVSPFEGLRLYIDDTPRISAVQMMARSRRIAARHGGQLDIIAVDHLGLMAPANAKDNRVGQLTQISGDLKALAKTLNVPVVALSQLSREVDKRNPPIPVSSDLRDSGSIEQDADVILFVYRSNYYTHSAADAGLGQIIISKQRNGPTGKVDVAWIKEAAKFENLLVETV